MRVLVTNDDGINSPGLWTLVEHLTSIAEVVVCAPDRDQSGTGPAMSILNTVTVHDVSVLRNGVQAYAVEGTPGDCVILATERLENKPFDVVVSGINQGANLGLDVLNSGTVGAAMHGFFRGIPAIAVSVASLEKVTYDAAARVAAMSAQELSESSLDSPLLLNVNLPNLEPEEIEGVEITCLGPKIYLENVEKLGDARRSRYWIRHNRPLNAPVVKGSDVWAVQNNRVSITPLGAIIFECNGSLSALDDLAKLMSKALIQDEKEG